MDNDTCCMYKNEDAKHDEKTLRNSSQWLKKRWIFKKGPHKF